MTKSSPWKIVSCFATRCNESVNDSSQWAPTRPGRVVITVTKCNYKGLIQYISWQQNADPWCRIDMPQQNDMTMPHLSWRNNNGFLWQKPFSWNRQVFHCGVLIAHYLLPLLSAVLVTHPPDRSVLPFIWQRYLVKQARKTYLETIVSNQTDNTSLVWRPLNALTETELSLYNADYTKYLQRKCLVITFCL